MEPDEQDDMPDQLKELIAGIKKKKEFNDHVDSQLNPHSDKVEKEILMTLWADLGNHFEYYQCLHAASSFLKALKGMRKVSKMPLPVAIVLQKTLVECAKADLEAMTMIQEAKEKYGYDD
jgi:hypothetical protein